VSRCIAVALALCISACVIGGMLFATLLGLPMIPVFYVSVRRVLGDKLDEVPEKRPHHDEDDRIEAQQK
jgi:multidrug efflux pump